MGLKRAVPVIALFLFFSFMAAAFAADIYIGFDPALPSSVCKDEAIDITVKGRAKFNPDTGDLLNCAWDDKTWVSYKLYLMEYDIWPNPDDEIDSAFRGGWSYDCATIYFNYTFEDVDLSAQAGGVEGNTIEVYAKVDGDKVTQNSTASYDVYNYLRGECQCISGSCCNLSSRPYKFKPAGSQPTGSTDYYFCSGTDSPTDTSYVNYRDYYCNGTSSSRQYSDSVRDTCGTCEYCTAGNSTCSSYSSSTRCGTQDCDYRDTACRDYSDVDRYCNGSGSCLTGSCNSYSDKPKGTYCGSGQECDGSGSCITCTSHSYFSCYSSDVYWYDQCDHMEEKKEECGEDSCGYWSYYCSSNELRKWRNCTDRGCFGDSCYKDIWKDDAFVETCADGCIETPAPAHCKKIACYTDTGCGHTWGDNVCRDNDVYQEYFGNYCRNPGTIDSYCDPYTEYFFRQDCGTSYCDPWGATYCKDGSVYHKRTCYNKGCSSGACTSTPYEEEQKAQDCGTAGCTSGKCNIACFNDSECNDSNSSTKDTCVNPGTSASYCRHEQIRCFQNSECGTDGWVGSPSCSQNDVFQNYRSYSCNSPGTPQSSCTSTDTAKLKQDCGQNYCNAWGAGYCKDGSVYHKRTCYNKGCSNGACTSTPYQEEQKAQDCGRAGCENGACKGFSLASPANGAAVSDTTVFEWNPGNLDYFMMQASNDSIFQKYSSLGTWITGTSLAITNHFKTLVKMETSDADKVLYWRVIGKQNKAQQQSEARAFKLNLPIAPTLQCPTQPVDSAYAFSWAPGEGVKVYLQIGYGSNFAKKTFSQIAAKINPTPIAAKYKTLAGYETKSGSGELFARIYAIDKYKRKTYSNVCKFTLKKP